MKFIDFIKKHKNEKTGNREVEIACLYASPEILEGKRNVEMGEVYASPKWKEDDSIVYPTFRLVSVNTGKLYEIQKPQIIVGRNQQCCDIVLHEISRQVVSRLHASFFFKNGIWYLQDENSTNGTWLNGERLSSDVTYQLHADDVIDFAHVESFIFESKEEIYPYIHCDIEEEE